MFQQEISCTASSAHNVHEAKYAGRAQEGGTGTICFGKSTGFITKIGQDEEGLGRWSWIRLSGTNGHATRIVTAYNPCKKQEHNLRNNLPLTTTALHHEEERSHLSHHIVPNTSNKTINAMESWRGEDSTIYGS
jgi:hypothetical protein